MRKRTKVMIWTGSIVVALGVSGIFATNFVLNKFLDSMAEQSISSLVDKSGEGIAKAAGQTSTDSKETGKSVDAAGGKSSSVKTGAVIDNVTPEKLKELNEDVTLSDKKRVMSILLKYLSISDIRKLEQLAKGGLTPEKKREARKIIHGKVSPDVYDELIFIATKYGVSQGKNYEEVLKEEERLQKKEKSN